MNKLYSISELSNLLYKKAQKDQALNPMARAYGSMEGFLHSVIDYSDSLSSIRKQINEKCIELEKELA